MHTIGRRIMKQGKGSVLRFLRLFRWPNLLIIILSQCLIRYGLIGRVYAESGSSPALSNLLFALLVLITLLIAAAGYAINDYFDVRTDRINRPQSQIVGRFLAGRSVIKLHMVLNGVAILAGFYISVRVGSFRLGLLFPLLTILLWFYSERYKCSVLAGNVIVSFLSAMVVLVVWLFEFFALRLEPDTFLMVYPSIGLINRLIFGYTLFAFLLSMMREVVKDAEDVEGDRTAGCNTLPVVYGLKTARIVTGALLAACMALLSGGIYWLYDRSMQIPALYFGVFVAVPLFLPGFRLINAADPRDFHQISRLLKLIMLAGVLGLIPLSFYL